MIYILNTAFAEAVEFACIEVKIHIQLVLCIAKKCF